MMYYTISPLLNEGTLFLTAQASSYTVAVAATNTQDPASQLWTPIECISPNQQGFVLLNKGCNFVIAETQSSGPVSLVPINDSRQAIWNLVVPDEDPEPPTTGYAALQLVPTTYPGMNLNVYQDGTDVYAWGWGNGTANELWIATTSHVTS